MSIYDDLAHVNKIPQNREDYDEEDYAMQIYPVIVEIFKKENISFENWFIFEIPVWSDDFIAVVLENDVTEQDLNLHISKDKQLDDVVIDWMVMDWKGDFGEYYFKTLKEAIESPYSYC